MFSQKSTRLIYQVAQPNPANLKVDQDELVDTLAVGLWTLNTLIEGSIALTVPALPTQSLIDEFVALVRLSYLLFFIFIVRPLSAPNEPLGSQVSSVSKALD